MFKNFNKKCDTQRLKRYAVYGITGGTATSSIWYIRNFIDGEAAALTSQALLKSFFIYLSMGLTVGSAIPFGVDLLMNIIAHFKKILTKQGYLPEDPLIRELKTIRREIAVFSQSARQTLYQSEEALRIEELLKVINHEITEAMKDFECIISLEIMREPVKAGDGHYYERAALQKWYDRGHRFCILNHHIPLENPQDLVIDIKQQEKIIDLLQTHLSNKNEKSNTVNKRCLVM